MTTYLDARSVRALFALSAVAAIALAITMSTTAGAHVQPGFTPANRSVVQTSTRGHDTDPLADAAMRPSVARTRTRSRLEQAVERLRAAARAHQAQHEQINAQLQEMIAAGNRIATLPYVYGGGHGSFIADGYDCSGSVSYVLHAAGLLSTPEDSGQLMDYGVPGPGKYVTIYANAGHAWMTIDGRRFDTISLQETGNRWSDSVPSGAGYVEVHPAGL